MVYEYNINKNKLSILFEGAEPKKGGTYYVIKMCLVHELDVLWLRITRMCICLGVRMKIVD